jgi:hypothetical protein
METVFELFFWITKKGKYGKEKWKAPHTHERYRNLRIVQQSFQARNIIEHS